MIQPDEKTEAGLLGLVECCETATGPSRELDALIDAVVNGRRPWSNPRLTVPSGQGDYYEEPEEGRLSETDLVARGVPLMVADHPEGEWAKGPNGRTVHKNPNRWRPRNYTASIDEALTLLPENADFTLDRIKWDGLATPCNASFHRCSGNAATPALAMCAAALRARATP